MMNNEGGGRWDWELAHNQKLLECVSNTESTYEKTISVGIQLLRPVPVGFWPWTAETRDHLYFERFLN
jgi:hypothetical protein